MLTGHQQGHDLRHRGWVHLRAAVLLGDHETGICIDEDREVRIHLRLQRHRGPQKSMGRLLEIIRRLLCRRSDGLYSSCALCGLICGCRAALLCRSRCLISGSRQGGTVCSRR